MRVCAGFEEWEPGSKTAVSLGNYDGVHLGHQAVLKRTVELGHLSGIPSVAVTFDPVPKKILTPETAPPLIQTLGQRLKKLESLGLDCAVVVAFNRILAQKKPDEFIQDFLIDRMRIKHFVVGENFSFGHQKRGNLQLLRKMGQISDFTVEGIPEIVRNGLRISSSQIRDFVQQGNMEEATSFLGRPFALTGIVVEGEHLGAKLGIPTANLDVENEILPAKGVYVCLVHVDGEAIPAVTNVGLRPTFDGSRLTVEAHLLDHSSDLYGLKIEIQFLRKLRDEIRFNGVEALKIQIHSDIAATRAYLSGI